MTRLFSIKYIEEVVKVDDACQFRAEVPYDPAEPEVEFVLKAELF